MPGSRAGVRSLPSGIALLLLGLALLLVVPGAARAARAYVANNDGTVSVIDTGSDRNIGTIKVGEHPGSIAITPDGHFAYVSDDDETVSVIDLRSGFLSTPIKIGGKPESVAISPDGQFAWVTIVSPPELLTIETATNRVVGEPIKVCEHPAGVAISPDGRFAYVACVTKGEVWAIDTQTRERIGEPLPVGKEAIDVAFTPDGRLAYVTDPEGGHVAVIDTATRFLGAPIVAAAGQRPYGLAVAPNGEVGYFASSFPASATAFSVATGQATPSTPTLAGFIDSAAITPDGRQVFFADTGTDLVYPYDAQTMQQAAQPIAVGNEPRDVAVAPDQPPDATFTVPDGRPALPLAFDASASSDPDGTVARYEWSFGDGTTLTNGGAKPKHAYQRPGDYKVTLTLTDDEGCSTSLVFTGSTASCNGSPTATQTQAVQVSYPSVRVRCPKSAGRRGCHFRLQAVTRRHRGKPESAVSKARAPAGRRAVVPLRTRKAFAGRVAAAKKVLVRERLTVRGRAKTRFLRLKIVR